MTSTIPTAWATNGIMAIPNSDSSMNEWRETPWTNSNLNNMWTDKSLPVSSGGFIQDFQMPQGPMTPSSLSRSEDLDFGDMILQTIDENTSTWQASSSPPNGGGVCPQLELSALLGEMQKYLHMLKIYHVSENRPPEDALNDYPIGEALYLLRRFCELQERVRPTGRSPSWTQSPIDPDMVAALVIVTCYMTMMRILRALFSHLEQYLSQITPETAMKARKNLAEHCRSLKLGELTPVNNVCVRTREAVGTLLSALRGMDMAIGTYHKMPWAADEMDDVTDCPAENTAREDGLTVNLLKEENISSKIDKDKTLLYAKILEVERHLDRLLNCSAGGQTAIA
ncbi:hypothetical protein NUW58_g1139 [Xylaria curta]|uniref:Uncharacterized protein n=1 Tax=Xylaria curta TaxID=42375 RepID=A0ACC1PLQ5_9PEZI|nr:hypothetical protein NUW58_g1139 [Xylaria curta]